jgi:hypothetical protein
MKIKVNDPHRDWSGIRQSIIWIFFLLILTAGAFGWGYIYRDFRADDLREKIYKIDERQKDMNGRLMAIEGKKK